MAPEKLGLRYQSIGAPSAQMACSQSGAAVRLGQRGRRRRKRPEDSYNKRPAERVLTSRTVDNGYRQSSATQRRLRRLPNLLGMAHPSRQHAGRFRPSAVVATTEVETAATVEPFKKRLIVEVTIGAIARRSAEQFVDAVSGKSSIWFQSFQFSLQHRVLGFGIDVNRSRLS